MGNGAVVDELERFYWRVCCKSSCVAEQRASKRSRQWGFVAATTGFSTTKDWDTQSPLSMSMLVVNSSSTTKSRFGPCYLLRKCPDWDWRRIVAHACCVSVSAVVRKYGFCERGPLRQSTAWRFYLFVFNRRSCFYLLKCAAVLFIGSKLKFCIVTVVCSRPV